VNAGYITRDRLLRDHLRQQQQVVYNIEVKRDPSLARWLETSKVEKTSDQANAGAQSVTLSMAA